MDKQPCVVAKDVGIAQLREDSQGQTVASAEPFVRLGAQIEWEYREDNNRYPRDFWHARVVCKELSGDWYQYGQQEQRELPGDVKAAAEVELRAQFNAAFACAVPTAQKRPRPPLDDVIIHRIIRETVAKKIIAGQDITPQDWIDFARNIEKEVAHSPADAPDADLAAAPPSESREDMGKRLIAEATGLDAVSLPAHDPTIAVEELLAEFEQDRRDDVWETIKSYADIQARSAVLIALPAAQARKEDLYLNPDDIDMIAAPWMAPDGEANASDVRAIVRAAISFCHDLRHMNPPQPGHRWVQVLAATQEQHPDEAAVDKFAAAMKAKLAKKRSQGRGGWQTADEALLSALLHEHVAKGDPVDVGNLAMMLHQNGQSIVAAPELALTGGAEPFAWAYKLTPLDLEWTVTRTRPQGHQILPLFTGVALAHPISGRT